MPYQSVQEARKKVASLKSFTTKQVEVFIAVFNDLEKKNVKEDSAYAQAIAAAKKVKKQIIIKEENYDIEKETYNDRKRLLQHAINEKFFFENGTLCDLDVDTDFVYFQINYWEHKGEGKTRYYDITYKLPYTIKDVTVFLGTELVKVEKITQYKEVEDKAPQVYEDGNVNRSMEWVENIVEKVLKRFKREESQDSNVAKEKDGCYYIEKFKEEEMKSWEPIYCPPNTSDADGEGMTEEEITKMVKNIKDKIDSGTMEFNLFHKVRSNVAEWVDCFSNPWPECYVGDHKVEKGQPVGVLQWKNKAAWEMRKAGRILGPSVEGKSGSKRKVGVDNAK